MKTQKLKNGTVLKISEDFIWVHPSGTHNRGSYRVNLQLKMVDFEEGTECLERAETQP